MWETITAMLKTLDVLTPIIIFVTLVGNSFVILRRLDKLLEKQDSIEDVSDDVSLEKRITKLKLNILSMAHTRSSLSKKDMLIIIDVLVDILRKNSNGLAATRLNNDLRTTLDNTGFKSLKYKEHQLSRLKSKMLNAGIMRLEGSTRNTVWFLDNQELK